ncbi:MAG: SET domain-containing protein-lysine N-methyltransferase [Deltaproteobacteria bacterium]|nr:SET domain-containing protein-lysine N-methyltransferase [Deltaproteobacteria bacterium]
MLHPSIVASRDRHIHGVCLVTNLEIRKGELVWELDEPIYSWKEIESWSADRRRDFDWYGFQCGVDEYSLPEGLSREMNHSCDPNTWWSGSTKLVARRDIQVGEEITYDYSTADIDHGSEMECSCGSPRCRGTVSNRDYLDPEWQSQYGTNLPPHVLAAIERAG